MKVRRSETSTRMSERGFAAARITLYLAVAAALMLGFRPVTNWAQAVNGSIVGTITDQTGAVVPGAKVTLTEENKNVSRSTNTDPSGNYSFPDVPPGTYKVTVEEQGFSTGVRGGVTLFVNSTDRVDLTLKPGAACSFAPTGSAPPILRNSITPTPVLAIPTLD